ncbi:thyroid adenoma-associated protein homolog [Nematolebias whitei]|uniref:thyroid adenoma-associated protein homolog n=1 Tax=Nematolebias whitei TaxID=451745 RepID=UPI00189C5794|nr:thyroid adenoma-associated protein homolog [Nematolebias whitei]
MVVKKKTSKVQAVVLDEDKLQQLMACLSVEEGNDGVIQLARTLRSCLELTDSVQQIQFFKKVATQLEALPEEKPGSVLDACLNTLVLVFTSLQAKNPLRRAVSRALGSVPEWLHHQTRTCLSTCLCDSMRNSSSEENPHMVDTISACMEGFPLGESCVRQRLFEG